MRFVLDMGVHLAVLEWLREQGHDAVHLREQGLGRLADQDIFAKGIAEGRIVVTFDLDFGEIAAFTRGRRASVILFRLRNTRAAHVIERLSRVLDESAAALAAGCIAIVEDERHRIRYYVKLG